MVKKLREYYMLRVPIYHGLKGCKTAEDACEEMAEVSPAFVRLIAYRLYGEKSRWGVDARWAFRFKHKENSRLAHQTRIANETKQVVDRDAAVWETRNAGETLKAVGRKFGISRERVRQICAKRQREMAMRFASRKYTTVEYEKTWTPQDQYQEFRRHRMPCDPLLLSDG